MPDFFPIKVEFKIPVHQCFGEIYQESLRGLDPRGGCKETYFDIMYVAPHFYGRKCSLIKQV
jgi:hypothetical protein